MLFINILGSDTFVPRSHGKVHSKFLILRSQAFTATTLQTTREPFWDLWTGRSPLHLAERFEGLHDIRMVKQLLQSLFVYSLALFYGFLASLGLLWQIIRNFGIPPGLKRRETRKPFSDHFTFQFRQLLYFFYKLCFSFTCNLKY